MQDARAYANGQTAALLAAAQQAAQRLANLAPWLVRGGYITLEAGLVGVLVIEVAVAGYLIYQLADATIGYFQAQAQATRLDQTVQQIQQRLNAVQVEGGPACCCLIDQSVSPDAAGAWSSSFFGESDCRATGAGHIPMHCYNGRPTQAQVAQQGGVAAACAYIHSHRPEDPNPTDQVNLRDIRFTCAGDPTQTEHQLSRTMDTPDGGSSSDFCEWIVGPGSYPIPVIPAGAADGGM